MNNATYLSSLFSMEGKVILITGASSGIGSHIAEVMAKAGGRVILAARRIEKIQKRAEEISHQTGREATAIFLDVTDPESIQKVFDTVEERFGVADVVCNNAGLARSGWAIDITEKDWDITMDTNLKGAWRIATESCRRLKKAQKPGSIINTASILGLGVAPVQTSYAVSKAAVIQMTKAMALEFIRYGIRINAVCPGYFKTEINHDYLESSLGQKMLAKTPAKRHGELEELAAAFLMLAGDGSRFISGIALPVDAAHHSQLV